MKSAKNIIDLTVITVIAVFLLGYVYDLTKAPIEEATLRAKQEAYRSVFNDASTFEPLAGFDSALISNTLTMLGFSGVAVDEGLAA